MIRTVIVDDEKIAGKTLKKLLEITNYPIEVVGEGDDIESGIRVICETKPDLVFLDIQLKTGTGFDLLEAIQKESLSTEIIFVTAYDEFAVKAFRMAALGYILKPVRLEDLNMILERYTDLIAKSGQGTRARVLIGNLDEGKVKKIVVSNNTGFKVLSLDKIVYMQGDVNYTHFILASGEKLITSKTLKEYEGLLKDYGFFRIHQSYLVNLAYVEEYIRADIGTVIMRGKVNLPVSRRRKKEFVQRFLGGK